MFSRSESGLCPDDGVSGSWTGLPAVPPPWAYGFEGPPQAGAKPTLIGPAIMDRTPRSIPGATAQYARAQIANRFGPADWFPGDPSPDA
jgi:hypothetical protein